MINTNDFCDPCWLDQHELLVMGIHVLIRMNYGNSDDSLTSHVAPSSGQYYISSNTLFFLQISTELQISINVSCTVC